MRLDIKPGRERERERPTESLKAKSQSKGKLGRMVQRVSKAFESAAHTTQHISALGDHQSYW